MAKLWLPNELFETMKSHASAKFPFETGGILLGYTADNQDVVATHLIGPGPNARHEKYRFEPDGDFQQKEIEKVFRETGGRITYLGDWHTHPLGVAVLSSTDKRTLEKIARSPETQNCHPLMAVLAGIPARWELNVFRFLFAHRKWFRAHYNLESLTTKFYAP